jgi:PleD family two-component response regulator
MDPALKLLVVDDDDVDRMAVRRALADAGLNIELTEAVNGAEALAAYDSTPFDCVILDHNLPDSTGASVFMDMLKNTASSAAVIFLTGEEDQTLAIKMMEIGAIDYLTKREISAPILARAIKYAKARQHFLTHLTAVGQIDTLTGLLNRSVFDGVLKKAIAQARRSNNIVAVAPSWIWIISRISTIRWGTRPATLC